MERGRWQNVNTSPESVEGKSTYTNRRGFHIIAMQNPESLFPPHRSLMIYPNRVGTALHLAGIRDLNIGFGPPLGKFIDSDPKRRCTVTTNDIDRPTGVTSLTKGPFIWRDVDITIAMPEGTETEMNGSYVNSALKQGVVRAAFPQLIGSTDIWNYALLASAGFVGSFEIIEDIPRLNPSELAFQTLIIGSASILFTAYLQRERRQINPDLSPAHFSATFYPQLDRYFLLRAYLGTHNLAYERRD
jgi:hypothetical protein